VKLVVISGDAGQLGELKALGFVGIMVLGAPISAITIS
jgi:hypothetical protein